MGARPLRILLFNLYYPPDTSATARMAQLVAEELAEPHQVTVIAGRPSYAPTERYPWRLLRKEERVNLIVQRVGSTAYSRGRIRQRLANYLSYVGLAVPRALMVRTDVLVAMTDPPFAGIVGALLARIKRCRFVYNIRDLHPDMAVAAGMIRPAFWVRAWEGLHRWALRQADCVVVLGDDMQERVFAKGVERSRISVVRDGSPITGFACVNDHPVVKEVRCGFNFVMLHAGNLGFYGAWETLVEAARLLEAEGVGLVFVGDGACKHRIAALADGSANIRFLDFRPAKDVPFVLAAGDLHVITVRPGLEGLVVPSKLYGILAAGRPVLAVVPPKSDTARIVGDSGTGIVANPTDPSAVATAVRWFMRNQKEREQMALMARSVAARYDQRTELHRFVQVVERVAGISKDQDKCVPTP